jgi:hypothetical protein
MCCSKEFADTIGAAGNLLQQLQSRSDTCFSSTILSNQQRSRQAGELKFKVLEHFVIVDIDASYHSDVPGLSEVT